MLPGNVYFRDGNESSSMRYFFILFPSLFKQKSDAEVSVLRLLQIASRVVSLRVTEGDTVRGFGQKRGAEPTPENVKNTPGRSSS